MKNSIQKETRDEPRDEADTEKAALLNRRSLLAGTSRHCERDRYTFGDKIRRGGHAGCAG